MNERPFTNCCLYCFHHRGTRGRLDFQESRDMRYDAGQQSWPFWLSVLSDLVLTLPLSNAFPTKPDSINYTNVDNSNIFTQQTGAWSVQCRLCCYRDTCFISKHWHLWLGLLPPLDIVGSHPGWGPVRNHVLVTAVATSTRCLSCLCKKELGSKHKQD